FLKPAPKKSPGFEVRVGGFTILEILVVIGITLMISALAITYKSQSQRQVSLYVETQRVVELILRAKSLAVSTYKDPNTVSDPTLVACGYGIDINYASNTYSLFSYKIPTGGNCSAIPAIDKSGGSGT